MTSECTGHLAERYPDQIEWAHSVFVCAASCPIQNGARS